MAFCQSVDSIWFANNCSIIVLNYPPLAQSILFSITAKIDNNDDKRSILPTSHHFAILPQHTRTQIQYINNGNDYA